MALTRTEVRQMTTEQIEVEIDQLKAELREVDSQRDDLNRSIKLLSDRLSSLTIAFQQGDIVEDEMGVKYRVARVNLYYGQLEVKGIRLTKEGYDAYKDPRTIWSTKLKVVKLDAK